MNEYVQITLDRYNKYLLYKEKYDLLIDTHNALIEVLEDENFDIKNKLHEKVYKIYEKIVLEE